MGLRILLVTARPSLRFQVRKKALSHFYRGEINPVMCFYFRQVFPNTANSNIVRKGNRHCFANWEKMGQYVLSKFLGNLGRSLVGCLCVYAQLARASFSAPKSWLGNCPLFRESHPTAGAGPGSPPQIVYICDHGRHH